MTTARWRRWGNRRGRIRCGATTGALLLLPQSPHWSHLHSQQSWPWAMPLLFSSCHHLCRRCDSCPAPCCHAIPCLCCLAMPPLAVIISVVPPATVPPLAIIVPLCCPSLCCPLPSLYHPSSTRPSSSCGLLCRHHADCSTPRRLHPPSSERQNLDLANWILSADHIKFYLLQYIA